MKLLNKEQILSIILEEISMDEMARGLGKSWPGSKELDDYKVFDLRGTKWEGSVASTNPETEELEQGMIYTNVVRVNDAGNEIYVFPNVLESGKVIKGYYEPEIAKYYKYPPRNSKLNTAYRGPERDKLRDTDPDEYLNAVDRNDEKESKRKVLYKTIRTTFNDNEVKLKLFMSGLPIISAGKDFTEATTIVERKMMFLGPDLNFELHSVRDEKDVQNAFEKVVAFREKLGANEDPDMSDLEAKKQVRKYGGNSYSGGYWPEVQRTFSEKYHELTPIYKLHMKAVQGGEIAYTLTSELKVKGIVVNNETYSLTLSLHFTRSSRDATKSKGVFKGEIIEPLIVRVEEALTDDLTDDLRVANNVSFYTNLFQNGLNELRGKILQINPDDTLPEIEPEEFDFDGDF